MPDLLNTSDVPLAPSAKTSETVLPDWYTNYAMQVLSNQQAVAGNPYPTYTSPRVAGFTPDQEAGMEATRAAAGAYQPGLAAAQGTVGALAGVRPSASASPWLSRAGVTSASQVRQYMDPYQDLVVDRIGELGARNLTERLLPAIGDQFVGAGGYGGTRQAEEIGRAVRDTQESISAEQNRALSVGYQGALGAAGTDLTRFGALAQTAGGLAESDVRSGLAVGDAQSRMAEQAQRLALNGAGALQQVGQQQQAMDQKNLDVGYEDFLRQQGWDQSRIDNLVKTLQGVAPAVPKSILEQGYGPVNADTSKSPSTAAAIASAIGALLLN